MGRMIDRLKDGKVVMIELLEERKAVWFLDFHPTAFAQSFDYREFGELIRELEAIRRQMVLMPLPPADLADDPNLYTTGGDY